MAHPEVIARTITDLRINHKSRDWCLLPYPDHPKGCPAYDRKSICPPVAPFIEDFFDLAKPIYLVAIQFDLSEHVRKMLSAHPTYSVRQARNCLYWQPTVRKQLEQETAKLCSFLSKVSGEYLVSILCPEAMGVNVIATARRCGIPVEIHPDRFVYKISLIGNRP